MAVDTVELTINGISSQDAEINLPGMRSVPLDLTAAREWLEDNWGRGSELTPNATVVQDVDVSLLYDFLTGPGIDVNDFVTDAPSMRITSSGDLDQYFKKLNAIKSIPDEPAPVPEEPMVVSKESFDQVLDKLLEVVDLEMGDMTISDDEDLGLSIDDISGGHTFINQMGCEELDKWLDLKLGKIPVQEQADFDQADFGEPFEPSGEYQRVVFRGLTLGDPDENGVIEALAGFGFPGVKYIGEIRTIPGQGGEGGRLDQVFDVPAEHVPRFAMWRLTYPGCSWWEDYATNDASIISPENEAKFAPGSTVDIDSEVRWGELPSDEDDAEDREYYAGYDYESKIDQLLGTESFDRVEFGDEEDPIARAQARLGLLRQLGAPAALIQREEALIKLMQQSPEEPPEPADEVPPAPVTQPDDDEDEEFEEAEDPFRYVEQEENWVVFSRDGDFISSPAAKELALDLRQKLEDDGVPARIAKEDDVQRALDHWQRESVPV